MKLENKTASELLGKNPEKSQAAAKSIVNTPDIEAWKCLLENSDYIFSFIREKAGNAIAREITQDNYQKVFDLIKFHAPEWDEYIAIGLSKINSEELTAKMLELLSEGSAEEKIYAARYFCAVQHLPACELLFESSKNYCQLLKTNAAEALGILRHEASYTYYLERLKSEDEWDKIEAAQFLANYGNKDAAIPILQAMENSGMAELLAGEIATLTDIYELFNDDEENTRKLALEALDNILSGIPEVWPLGVILDFKIYDCLEKVLNLSKKQEQNQFSGLYAQILLKAKQKFGMFVDNSQYTYDEEKDVLSELDEIYHLLLYENEKYWEEQLKTLLKELESSDKKRKIAAIALLSEMEIQESIPGLLQLTTSESEDESVLSEAIIAISKMGHSSKVNKDLVLSRITDPNLSAVAENYLKGYISHQVNF